MLAEPRRKQRFSADPRNLNWSNDDNRFGKKLMERMGWEKGKGLGANEDGNPDHISIRLKEDKYGVGCTSDYADNWVAHQDDFNALLTTLNANSSTEEPPKAPVQSLEERSKSSKGRIHYKKFAKGKDLTKANTEDMNCIFGRRLSKSAPSTPQCQSEASSDAEDSEDESKEHGVVTIKSATTVQDYFKQKMAALKAKSQGVSVSAPTSANPSDEETKETNESNSANCDDSDEPVKKKKSKKSKRSRDLEKESDAKLESADTEVVKAKSKKNKKQKKDTNQPEYDNDADEKVMQSSPEADDTEKSGKKKKKRKRETRDEPEESEMDYNEIKRSKKKRRKAKDLPEDTNDVSSEKKEHGNTENTDSSDETMGESLEEQTVNPKNSKRDNDLKPDNDEELPNKSAKVEKKDAVKPKKKRKDHVRAGEKFSKNPSKYFKGANLENIKGYGR